MFQGETYAQGNKAQMEHSRSFFQTLAFNDKGKKWRWRRRKVN